MNEVIQVTGLRDLQRALKDFAEGTTRELATAMKTIATRVADDVRGRVPVKSGTAARTVKASGTARGAAIKAGGDRAPYYQWLDFGGKVGRDRSVSRNFIRSGRYIYPSIARHHEETTRLVDDVVRTLAIKAGFETSGHL